MTAWPRSSTGRYVLARVAQSAFVLFGAVAISFLLTAVSGNAARILAGGPYATPAQVREVEKEFGFDRPVLERFVDYLGGVARGDMGASYLYGDSALDLALQALPYTLLLAGCALALAVSISLPIAIGSALRREGIVDRSSRITVTVIQGMPDFWIALMLVLVFSVHFSIFPAVGFSGAGSLVLPAVALALPLVPAMTLLFRGLLLDVMQMDFIDALRAKGLSEREIMLRHALRNILPPGITWIALQAGWLMGGTILIESIFAWPGVGSLMLQSVASRDVFVVQAIVIVIGIGYVVFNLVADLLVLWLDPRIRLGRA